MASRHSVITDDDELEDDDFDSSFLMEDEEEDDSEDNEEGETEESGQSNSQDDWESRFRGLQSSLQRSQEMAAQAQQEALMAKAESFKTQLMAQNLDPVEADRQYKLWLAAQAVEYQHRQNMSDQQALEYVGRTNYLQQLVTTYGIDTKSKTFERLSRIKDAEDMKAFAEEYAAQKKTATKQTGKAVRKAKGSDRFDSGGGRVGTPPRKKAKTLDDAASILSRYKIEF